MVGCCCFAVRLLSVGTDYRKVSPLRCAVRWCFFGGCFDGVFWSFLGVAFVVCIGEIYLPSGK